jgi:hypothetical protein
LGKVDDFFLGEAWALLVVPLCAESELLPLDIAVAVLRFSFARVIGTGEGVGSGKAALFLMLRGMRVDLIVRAAGVEPRAGVRPAPIFFPQLAELGSPVAMPVSQNPTKRP